MNLWRHRAGGKSAVSRDRAIIATPRDVWAVVSDVSRAPQWWPRAKRGEVLDGEGAGRRQRLILNWGRNDGIVEQKVTEWDPPRRYAWRVESEAAGDRPLPPLGRATVLIEVLPEGATSRVRITGSWEATSARGFAALRQLVRAARVTYGKALKNLDRLLSP